MVLKETIDHVRRFRIMNYDLEKKMFEAPVIIKALTETLEGKRFHTHNYTANYVRFSNDVIQSMDFDTHTVDFDFEDSVFCNIYDIDNGDIRIHCKKMGGSF